MARKENICNVEMHHNFFFLLLTEHIYGVEHIDLNVEPVDDLRGEFSDEDYV